MPEPTSSPEQTAAADPLDGVAREVLPVIGGGNSPEPGTASTPDEAPAAATPEERTPPAAPSGCRVSVAEPFEMISREAAFATARWVSVESIRRWLDGPVFGRRLLFDDARRAGCPDVAVVPAESAVPVPLWVVGDLHADVLTLANIIAHAERTAAAGERPSFLFLGDFVDRGVHDHETLLLLFKLVMADPSRVCVIPGNHDLDLRWDEARGRFRATIDPAEYCEWLNDVAESDAPADREQVELARLFIRFCKERPKAVILPDGTLFAHGGFPHTDTHDSLQSLSDLADARCVSDFVWARLSESPKKRPNRGNRGHEFGWRDFAQFCRVMTERVGVPVRRLVRGHDHVPERWRLHPEYAEAPVLTLNAMCRRMDAEQGAHPFPVIARHVPGGLPELVLLPLAAGEVDRAFELDRASPAAGIEGYFAPAVEPPTGGGPGDRA
jgi:hypothetical protein